MMGAIAYERAVTATDTLSRKDKGFAWYLSLKRKFNMKIKSSNMRRQHTDDRRGFQWTEMTDL